MSYGSEYYLKHRARRLAQARIYHLATRERHLAQMKARYQRHRLEVLKERRAYRKSLAGQLNEVRHNAKRRH